mmetsp:Transcript_15169/g.60947  ORF Transcript_15169/g.60947 Transcript_15169/m.60947 type:complete len:80 (-) Transcript_15169:323-562(-)
MIHEREWGPGLGEVCALRRKRGTNPHETSRPPTGLLHPQFSEENTRLLSSATIQHNNLGDDDDDDNVKKVWRIVTQRRV